MTEFNPLGQHVTFGHISGKVVTVVRKGDRYMTDRRNDQRITPTPVNNGERFAVAVDRLNRSHHVLLNQI